MKNLDACTRMAHHRLRSRLTKPGSSLGRYRPKLTTKLLLAIGRARCMGNIPSALSSAFAALVRVTKDALTVEGTLKTFSSIGGSGNPILRHFCPECGSSIAEEPGTRPGIIILNVGTFGDPVIRPSQKRDGRFFVKTRCRGSRCTAKYRASQNGPTELHE
jgi:hypothetical protein